MKPLDMKDVISILTMCDICPGHKEIYLELNSQEEGVELGEFVMTRPQARIARDWLSAWLEEQDDE